QLGMAGGGHAGYVENILGGIGHSMHRAAPFATHDLSFRRPRLRDRKVLRHRNIGMIGRIRRGDTYKQRLREFDRRQLARADQPRRLRDGEVGKIVHSPPPNLAGSNAMAGSVTAENSAGSGLREAVPRATAAAIASG